MPHNNRTRGPTRVAVEGMEERRTRARKWWQCVGAVMAHGAWRRGRLGLPGEAGN